MKAKNQEEEKFELKLFNSLKQYGYLIPRSLEDVNNFEKLYGDTEVDTPPIETFENQLEGFFIELDNPLRNAAFSSSTDDDLLPPNKSDSSNIEDENDS